MSLYKGKSLARCYWCERYIVLNDQSHAQLVIGHRFFYVHSGNCLKLTRANDHRIVTIKEVNRG